MEGKISQLFGYTDSTKRIPSKKFPGIRYVPGEDVWVSNLSKNGEKSISFDLSKEITADGEAVKLAGEALDRLEENGARKYMKEVAADSANQGYDALRGYFELHAAGNASLGDAGGEKKPANFLADFVDQLTLERLGGVMRKNQKTPVFIMDFSFSGRQRGELLAVYFDTSLSPFNIAIES